MVVEALPDLPEASGVPAPRGEAVGAAVHGADPEQGHHRGEQPENSDPQAGFLPSLTCSQRLSAAGEEVGAPVSPSSPQAPRSSQQRNSCLEPARPLGLPRPAPSPHPLTGAGRGRCLGESRPMAFTL